VRSAFAGHDGLAGVVDGGTRNGRVSTVVEISGSTWRILREGAVATPEIAAVLERGAATAG
jgi:tRNA A37 threonylcarbamoyladenosine synthetase subunit TsaC/SUA5/YrdC